jgi:hypothetical protein
MHLAETNLSYRFHCLLLVVLLDDQDVESKQPRTEYLLIQDPRLSSHDSQADGSQIASLSQAQDEAVPHEEDDGWTIVVR